LFVIYLIITITESMLFMFKTSTVMLIYPQWS